MAARNSGGAGVRRRDRPSPQAGEHERAVRKYEKALRYIDQGGFLGEDKVQVRAAAALATTPPGGFLGVATVLGGAAGGGPPPPPPPPR